MLHSHGVGLVFAVALSMVLVCRFRKLSEAGNGRRTAMAPIYEITAPGQVLRQRELERVLEQRQSSG